MFGEPALAGGDGAVGGHTPPCEGGLGGVGFGLVRKPPVTCAAGSLLLVGVLVCPSAHPIAPNPGRYVHALHCDCEEQSAQQASAEVLALTE